MSKSTFDHPRLTLVLMAGLPGAGKTTLARKLNEELGWEVIDKDGMIEALLRKKLDKGEKLDENEASHEAYDKSFDAVRQFLNRNHSVILDTATLHSFIFENAKSIASEMRAQLKILFLVADSNLRNERIRCRPPQITVIRQTDPETFGEYFGRFNYLPEFPDRFTLDTRKLLEECCSRSIQYLLSSADDRALLVDDEANLRSEDFVTV